MRVCPQEEHWTQAWPRWVEVREAVGNGSSHAGQGAMATSTVMIFQFRCLGSGWGHRRSRESQAGLDEPNVRRGTSCIKGRRVSRDGVYQGAACVKPGLTDTDRKFNFHQQV